MRTIAVKRVLAAVVALVLGVTIAESVHAQSRVFKDSEGAVYVQYTPGAVPPKAVEFYYNNIPVSRQIGTDTCGTIAIPRGMSNTTFRIVDGSTTTERQSSYDPPTVAYYRCQDGNRSTDLSQWESLSNGFKTAVVGDKHLVTGFSGYRKVTLIDTNSATKRIVPFNGCGYAKIKPTEKYPIARFSIYGADQIDYQTEFNYSTLTQDSAPLCRKDVVYRRCLTGDISCDMAGPGYTGEPSGSTGGNPGGGSGDTGGGTVTIPEWFVSGGDLYWKNGIPGKAYTAFDGEIWRVAFPNACGYVSFGWWAYDRDLFVYDSDGQSTMLVRHAPPSAASYPLPECP